MAVTSVVKKFTFNDLDKCINISSAMYRVPEDGRREIEEKAREIASNSS